LELRLDKISNEEIENKEKYPNGVYFLDETQDDNNLDFQNVLSV